MSKQTGRKSGKPEPGGCNELRGQVAFLAGRLILLEEQVKRLEQLTVSGINETLQRQEQLLESTFKTSNNFDALRGQLEKVESMITAFQAICIVPEGSA